MDKIILIFYIQIGKRPMDVIKQEIYEFNLLIKERLGDDILYFIMPTTDVSHVDCVNPKLISGDEYSHVKDVLENNTILLQEFLNNNVK